MAKSNIISVVRTWGRYGVVYDTGLRRSYSADNLPKTVQAWLDAKQIQDEPDQEPAAEPETEPGSDPEPEAEVEAEAVEIVLEPIITDPEYHDTPIPPRDELQRGSDPARHPAASQAVILWMCLSLAAVVFVILSLAELATIALYNVAWHLWSDRERILARILARIQSAAAGSIRMAAAGAVTAAEATIAATF